MRPLLSQAGTQFVETRCFFFWHALTTRDRGLCLEGARWRAPLGARRFSPQAGASLVETHCNFLHALALLDRGLCLGGACWRAPLHSTSGHAAHGNLLQLNLHSLTLLNSGS